MTGESRPRAGAAPEPSAAVLRQLAPSGRLDAGINLGNPLLVTGRDADGRPHGIAPDMAEWVAERLGVPCHLHGFPRPGDTADAVDRCGIVLVAIDPERAQTIGFSKAYVGIPATCLIKPGIPASSLAELDRPGMRIVVSERSAYDLWMSRHMQAATLVRIKGLEAAAAHFRTTDAEVLAGLRPALIEQSAQFAGSRLLDDDFDIVQQAIGTQPAHSEAIAFLDGLVREARETGLVTRSAARHGVHGVLTT